MESNMVMLENELERVTYRANKWHEKFMAIKKDRGKELDDQEQVTHNDDDDDDDDDNNNE